MEVADKRKPRRRRWRVACSSWTSKLEEEEYDNDGEGYCEGDEHGDPGLLPNLARPRRF